MPDNSFDVVSKIEMPEVLNAVQQALKEREPFYVQINMEHEYSIHLGAA